MYNEKKLYSVRSPTTVQAENTWSKRILPQSYTQPVWNVRVAATDVHQRYGHAWDTPSFLLSTTNPTWFFHFTRSVQPYICTLNSRHFAYMTSRTTYLLTYSMMKSPSWEANRFAASQEIPHISRNPKVHYDTHKHPPPVSILGQPNPVHIPKSHLLEIHPNIIHPSTPRRTTYICTLTQSTLLVEHVISSIWTNCITTRSRRQFRICTTTYDLTLYSFSSLYIFVTWGWPTWPKHVVSLTKQIQI